MIFVIATLTLNPGMEGTLLAAAEPAIAETRKEAGCIGYDLHKSITDDLTFVFVERWESRAALSAHMQAPHFLTWRAAGSPAIAGRRIEIITPEGVEVIG